MISILHLINLNDLGISVIFKKQKQTKQKQISKIEETNILIENPNTQNKNESNLNPKKKKFRFLRCVRNNLSQFNWQHVLRILE